jgi:uncharacterized Zn-binding protein involved in type VI secretion
MTPHTPLSALYVGSFSLAAVGCLVAAWRARQVTGQEIRRGLVGLLVTSAVWAVGQAGGLVVTSRPVVTALYTGGLLAGLASVGAWLYFCSAFAGESYHREPTYRRVAVAAFVAVATIKLTNPIHGLYYSLTVVQTPFPHVAIQLETIHWAVTILAYSLSAVGLYMLFGTFRDAKVPADSLAVLTGVTVLPVLMDIVGFLPGSPVLQLNYEPLGVAVFALGSLYLAEETFDQVCWTGSEQVLAALDEAVLVLDESNAVRDYNAAAARLFPAVPECLGQPVETVSPALADALGSGDRAAESAGPGVTTGDTGEGRSGSATDGGQLWTDGPDVGAVGAPTTDDILTLSGPDDTRHYLLEATPLTLGPQQVGQAVICADVTRVERQRRLLERQHEQLEGFSAAVTHELRNVLAIAEGHTDLAASAIEADNVDTAAEAVGTVDNAIRRMTAVVSDLAALARLGQSVADPERLDFRAAVADAAGTADVAGVTVVANGDGTVAAERQRFRELVRNGVLLAAGTDAGRLTVSLVDDGFVLQTDGTDLGDATSEHLFEYGQAVPTAETGMCGPNLQALARAHGWAASADIEEEGITIRVSGVDVTRTSDGKSSPEAAEPGE